MGKRREKGSVTPLTQEQKEEVEKYRMLVYKIVNGIWNERPWIRNVGDKEDYIQEAFMAVCRCITSGTYDPGKAKLTVYMYTAIRRSIEGYAFSKGNMRVPQNVGGRIVTRRLKRWEVFDNKTLPPWVEMDLMDCMKDMRPRDARIARRSLWDGATLKDIAAEEGVCTERVRQLLERAKSRIKAVFDG